MLRIGRFRHICAVALPLLLLAGCGGEVGMMLAGVSMVSFATTDKFLTDHAASYATGEECSSLQLEQTGAFCRTAEEIAAEQAEEEARLQAAAPDIYCYRTLAKITCYQQPDHQASLAQRVQ
jgi:hypothetical protein